MDPIPHYFIVHNGKLKKRSGLLNLTKEMHDNPALSRTTLDREAAQDYFKYRRITPTKDQLENRRMKIVHARAKLNKQTQKIGGERRRTKKYRR